MNVEYGGDVSACIAERLNRSASDLRAILDSVRSLQPINDLCDSISSSGHAGQQFRQLAKLATELVGSSSQDRDNLLREWSIRLGFFEMSRYMDGPASEHDSLSATSSDQGGRYIVIPSETLKKRCMYKPQY
jgi:hypothetical protein